VQARVADITYIRTRSGWVYLAAVLDLYSRKMVGWAMAPTMPAELVCSALQMAITQRNPPSGLIVHSDWGSQYASLEYQQLLNCYQLQGSMSRKAAGIMPSWNAFGNEITPTTTKPFVILPTTSFAFTTAIAYIQPWGICLPITMSNI
jgi:transposase InsO family protein